jgi:predicted ATPase
VQDGRCRLTAKASLHLPSSIQDVIAARVDALPESAKQVLKTASVIEREFGYELIKRVSGYQEDELASCLSVLKDAELIYQRGFFPETTYIFKHALTMEVVYASLLTSQKQEIHHKVGLAIEALYPNALEEHCATLARHFSKGGLFEQAAKYAKAAAR